MNPMTLADDLDRLEVLKRKSERVGRYKTERAEAFKTHEQHCVERMQAERSKSHRSEDGVLFTRIDDRVKGQVEDRRKYVRWALEQDEGVQEFLGYIHGALVDAYERGRVSDGYAALEADFYDLLVGGLELVAVKEKQDRCNAQARAHIDDEAPLPPGLTFRPDPYVQMRRS